MRKYIQKHPYTYHYKRNLEKQPLYIQNEFKNKKNRKYLKDGFYAAPSSIPNAKKGLFSVLTIQPLTLISYYPGVKHRFNSTSADHASDLYLKKYSKRIKALKEQYLVSYRHNKKTVIIDPTDRKGQIDNPRNNYAAYINEPMVNKTANVMLINESETDLPLFHSCTLIPKNTELTAIYYGEMGKRDPVLWDVGKQCTTGYGFGKELDLQYTVLDEPQGVITFANGLMEWELYPLYSKTPYRKLANLPRRKLSLKYNGKDTELKYIDKVRLPGFDFDNILVFVLLHENRKKFQVVSAFADKDEVYDGFDETDGEYVFKNHVPQILRPFINYDLEYRGAYADYKASLLGFRAYAFELDKKDVFIRYRILPV